MLPASVGNYLQKAQQLLSQQYMALKDKYSVVQQLDTRFKELPSDVGIKAAESFFLSAGVAVILAKFSGNSPTYAFRYGITGSTISFVDTFVRPILHKYLPNSTSPALPSSLSPSSPPQPLSSDSNSLEHVESTHSLSSSSSSSSSPQPVASTAEKAQTVQSSILEQTSRAAIRNAGLAIGAHIINMLFGDSFSLPRITLQTIVLLALTAQATDRKFSEDKTIRALYL